MGDEDAPQTALVERMEDETGVGVQRRRASDVVVG